MSPSADAHARAVANLRNALQAVSIQGLRNAARLWNWPIKGVAKAEIVQQLMEHLGNTQEMATAFRGLPLTHRQAAIWLAHMGVVEEPAETLRMVIGITEGRELAKATIAHAITELRQRLIVLEGSYQGIFVPEVYREWLPSAEAAQLLYAGQPTPGGRPEIVPAFNLDQLNQHVEQLLTLIEREQPSLQQAQAASAPAQPAMQPLGQPPAGPALPRRASRHWRRSRRGCPMPAGATGGAHHTDSAPGGGASSGGRRLALVGLAVPWRTGSGRGRSGRIGQVLLGVAAGAAVATTVADAVARTLVTPVANQGRAR